MSAVKLIPASGGGSVSLSPPNSTSGADVTLTLPSTSRTLGSVLEQFFYPCVGETVTTSEGNITLENVTSGQTGTTTYTDVTGSTIAYTPPAGTTTVIYEFQYMHSKAAHELQIGHFKFFIDSDEVTKAYLTHGAEDVLDLVTFKWPIRIGGTADTTTGRVASWTSNKTLKMQYRDYSNDNDTKLHRAAFTDGTTSDTFIVPRIGITALTT
tara:strand:- start:1066 stop:1698 length:633 start_codon:yes stop_codon:yes gene_type:complete